MLQTGIVPFPWQGQGLPCQEVYFRPYLFDIDNSFPGKLLTASNSQVQLQAKHFHLIPCRKPTCVRETAFIARFKRLKKYQKLTLVFHSYKYVPMVTSFLYFHTDCRCDALQSPELRVSSLTLMVEINFFFIYCSQSRLSLFSQQGLILMFGFTIPDHQTKCSVFTADFWTRSRDIFDSLDD